MPLGHLGLLRTQVRAFFAGQPLGKAAQQDDDTALHIEAPVVIDAEPLVFNAETHEHQLRRDIELGLARIEPHQRIVGMREALLAAGPVDGEPAAIGAASGPLQRDLLVPAAVLATGLETEGLELARDVARGDLVPAAAGVTAFEQVVREELDMRAKTLRCERRRSGLSLRGDGKKGEERDNVFLFMRS